MYKKRIIIGLFTAVLLLLVLILQQRTDKQPCGILFQISYKEGKECIKPWQSERGEYYAFIPSNVELSEVCVQLQTTDSVWLGDRLLENGISCEDFLWDIGYSYVRSSGRQISESTLTFVHSDNVSTIFLETQSGDMQYIHGNKENHEPGVIRVYLVDGELNFLGNVRSVEGRGNDSWVSYDKKAYHIKFEQHINLLDMGAAKNWVLLANASDSSHLRNKLAFLLAEKCGLSNSPDTQWVDLYLNGEYSGLYLLSEKNEVHENRLNISMEDGILVSLELEERLESQSIPYIVTDNSQPLRIHHPVIPEKYDEILKKWQSIENAILSSDGIDVETGKRYEELIDVESWRRKYLLEEVLGNLDACRISQFFYTAGSGKMYAGPVWDYDLAMGNECKWQLNSASCLFADRYEVKAGVIAPWFHALCQKEEFRMSIIQDYRELFKPQLIQLLDNELRQFQQILTNAAAMNQIRWSENTTMTQAIDHLYNYLLERIAFLDSYWIENGDYCIVKVDDGSGSNYSYVAVMRGTTMRNLPELQDNSFRIFTGWYTAENAPFDLSQRIYEDIQIYAKWENTPKNDWKRALKMIPVCMVGIMFIVLLVVDSKRSVQNGGRKWKIRNS